MLAPPRLLIEIHGERAAGRTGGNCDGNVAQGCSRPVVLRGETAMATVTVTQIQIKINIKTIEENQ